MNLPNSPDIRYIRLVDVYLIVFNLVKTVLDIDPVDNPLPDYRHEDDGSLNKCLDLVKNDDYYPGFLDKAAYLFVAIIKNHFFSNGNKRLAYVVLVYFLNINGWTYKRQSDLALKDVAIYIADSERNQNASFEALKNYAGQYLANNIVPISSWQQ